MAEVHPWALATGSYRKEKEEEMFYFIKMAGSSWLHLGRGGGHL
jgi:hypothetical protein